MNIILRVLKSDGSVWAVLANNNRFMIVHQERGAFFWAITGEEYSDPDSAIKAIKHLANG